MEKDRKTGGKEEEKRGKRKERRRPGDQHGMAGQSKSFAITLVSEGRPVLRQNENGPCFVIALVNAVLLGDSNLDAAFREVLVNMATATPPKQVPLDTVYTFLVERLLHRADADNNAEADTDHASSGRIMDTLPILDSGLLINPAFNNIQVFDFGEYSSSIVRMLDLFGLKLYHCFIMPSELLARLEEADIKPTFDQCQDYLVSRLEEEEKEDGSADLLAKDVDVFLSNNSTEFTPAGFQILVDSLDDNQVFLFFRNDHFNTCIKHAGLIYSLVTDIGYINQPDIVWLPLSIYDEGDFLNSNFENSKIKSTPQPAADASTDPHSPLQQQEDTDLLLAKQLQLQEDNEISKNLQETFDKEEKSKNQPPIAKKNSFAPARKAPKPNAKSTPRKPSQSSGKVESKPKSKSNSKAQLKSSNSQSCVIV